MTDLHEKPPSTTLGTLILLDRTRFDLTENVTILGYTLPFNTGCRATRFAVSGRCMS